MLALPHQDGWVINTYYGKSHSTMVPGWRRMMRSSLLTILWNFCFMCFLLLAITDLRLIVVCQWDKSISTALLSFFSSVLLSLTTTEVRLSLFSGNISQFPWIKVLFWSLFGYQHDSSISPPVLKCVYNKYYWQNVAYNTQWTRMPFYLANSTCFFDLSLWKYLQ